MHELVDSYDQVVVQVAERSIYGFYRKTAPFIDFILSLQFLRFYVVKYRNFYE